MNKRQPFVVGPFAIVFTGAALAVSAMDELFSGFPRTGDGHELQVQLATHGDTYEAVVDDQLVASASSIGELCIAVTRVLNRRVLDAEPTILHLHAGSVTTGERTALIVGPSMSGKSTIVATLISRGWHYLSDEQLGVLPDGRLVPYPRPITLRRQSWSLFDSVASHTDKLGDGFDRVEVSPNLLGPVHRGGPVAPTLVIASRVNANASIIERLTAAEAATVMLADSLDLERAGQQGIESIVAIASSAPAYRVAASASATVCDHIERLAELDDQVCATIVDHDKVHPDESSIRVQGTSGWLFSDGSAALYERETGTLAQLDEAGYLAWKSFRNLSASAAESDLASFARELRAAGLLGGPTSVHPTAAP